MNDKIDVSQMSFDELHAAHIALWDWLANHPEARKTNWTGWGRYDAKVYRSCFACVYAKRLRRDNELEPCRCCPIKDWSATDYRGIMPRCTSSNSLYMQWDDVHKRLTDRAAVAALAAQIRDLPWVEREVSK
jgi:hypothetical protein